MSQEDLVFTCLFFILSRSTNSLDSFLSGIAYHLGRYDKSLPTGGQLKSFKRAVKRLFGPADTPVQAYALLKNEVSAMITMLDPLVPDHACLASWLLLSFLFALRPEDVTHGRVRWLDFEFHQDGSLDLVVQPGKSKGRVGSKKFSLPPAPQGLGLNPLKWVLSWWHHNFSRRTVRPEDLRRRVFIDAVSGRPLSSVVLSDRLNKLYEATFGSPAPSRLSAYSLRRGGASEYFNEGGDPVHLQHLMRHSSFSTTANYIDTVSTRNSRMALTGLLMKPS